MKKGQAVLEFLMTYGWALIIVVAIVLAIVLTTVLYKGNNNISDEQKYCEIKGETFISTVTIETEKLIKCSEHTYNFTVDSTKSGAKEIKEGMILHGLLTG